MLKHKKLLLVTSLITLLPILAGLLLWNQFPERVAIHWSASGQADGFGSAGYAVFVPPLLMLAGHWICYAATCMDKGNRNRNRKPLALVLWIIPIVSNISSLTVYTLALGWDFSPASITLIPLGLLFAAIGNYLPKMKTNSTMGIKVPWAYTSEENWNATHRLGGRIWLLGGLVIALGGLLPLDLGIWLMLAVLAVMIAVPVIYSWRYYKAQKARGDALQPISGVNGKWNKISLLILAAVLLLVAVLLFAGEINVTFGEEAFTIEASFYQALTVDYSRVQAIELRAGNVAGIRSGGFGSLRLELGRFQNEEFGAYTRYTYFNPEQCIVLTGGGSTLVLSGRDAAETGMIYQTLLTKINIQ